MGRLLEMSSFVKPGHGLKCLFLIAFAKVDLEGKKQDACRYCASSMCVSFLQIITERDGLVFVIVAKIYNALSGMVGSVWGATVGLMAGFVIDGVGL